MSYNLTHTGLEVDRAIDKVLNITPSAEEINEAIDKVLDIEPTAEEINEAIRSVGNKVDKEEGKGLISDEELAKLANVKRADWGDNNPFSWAYIKNRTHSFLPWSEEATIDISEETLGSLISPVSQFFSVNGIAHSSEEANGQEFEVQDSTGYDRFDVVFQGESAYLRHTWHGGTDRTISVYPSGNVTPLTSAYIPKEIARKKDVDNKVAEGVANKADTDKYYAGMAVGVADNLRGRGEATEEEFTCRPSAGASNSISEEGVATMKRIKGNSLVLNQLSNVDGTLDFYLQQDIPPVGYWKLFTDDKEITPSANNGIISVPIKEGGTWQGIMQTISKLPIGAKVMIVTKVRYTYDETLGTVELLNGYGSQWTYGLTPLTSGIWYNIVDFYTVEKAGRGNETFGCRLGGGKGNHEGIMDIAKLKLYNLTQMFDAGNEPTTIDEFYARIPEGVDINAYNAGELMSMNINVIRTNALNQWDEQWEVGRINLDTGGLINNSTSIRSKNFIPVIGGETYNFHCERTGITLYFRVATYDVNQKHIGYVKSGIYPSTSATAANHNNPWTFDKDVAYIKFDVVDAYGTTYNNDICINLSHSGVRDGEYEPYEEHTQDLPEITRYFPDGMKSVGGVFDEINEQEAVQRLGQRAYAEGDNNNPAVMTDGVNTIYPLDTPIVTPIPTRSINLNYPVWDWGTERAVSDVPSAPFRADIIYGFNAVDTIRRNKRDIKEKQDKLTITVKDNGNIVFGNIEGQTKEFMPATPSGDPMHYYYISQFGVTYNAATGFFELEYLKNLTANDMRNAVRVSGDWRHMFNNASSLNSMVNENMRPRTNIAMMSGNITAEKYRHPLWQTELEQFIIGKCNEYDTSTLINIWNRNDGLLFSLAGLYKLRFIVGAIDISTLRENAISEVLRDSVTALEEVRLTNLSTSQSILYQPNLSKQSVKFLLENRTNTAEISLGLPDVLYDKIMTDGGEWADLRTLCQASGSKGAVLLEKNA